jgi:hypothetical protein
MLQLDTRSALVATATGVMAYLGSTVVVLPLLATSVVSSGAAVTAGVVLGAQLVALALAGFAAALVRRRRPASTRAAAAASAGAGGLAGGLLVLVLGAAAGAANGAPGPPPVAVVLTVLLWTLVPAGAAALVPPAHDPRALGYGVPAARPAARRHPETGAATLETVGMTSIAVVLIVAVIVAMAPRTAVVDRLREALCQLATLGQGTCGDATTSAEQHKPTDACVRVNSTDKRNASLAVTFVAVKGGGTIRVEEMSDGTYRVSAEGSGGIGVTEGLGGGVSVTVDDYIHGGEAQLSGSAYLEAAGGATWVVDEAGKDELVGFLKDQRDWATLQAGLSTAGPLGSVAGGVAWAGKSVWDWVTGDSYTPPSPTEVYGQAGIGGDGSASGAGIVTGGAVKAAQSTALGSRVDVTTGETTVYYTSTISGSAALTNQDPLNSTQLQAAGEMKVMLAVTVDSEGNPVKVSTQALAVGDAKAFVQNAFSGVQIDEHPSNGNLFEASVEITGPETERIAVDLLTATGILPTTPANRVTSGYDALTTFTGAARDRGIMTLQEVELDSNTSFGIQAGGKVGPVALGGAFENSTQTVTSGDAYYFDGKGWQAWAECSV